MNIFRKVTLQSLKKNRTRTAVTIVGVALSAAMICAVTTFAASVQNYAMREQIYSAGNWHAAALGRDRATCLTVQNSDSVAAAVSFERLGYAEAAGSENEFKPYLYLLGAAGDAADVLPIHMTGGRFPEAPDEILLPDHLASNGGVQHRLGERLTLALGQRVLDGDVLTQQSPCYVESKEGTVRNQETLQIRETRTYTVVGFYERLNYRIEPISAPGYTALTLADAQPASDMLFDVYFRMKRPGDVFSFLSENGLGDQTNRELLMYTGTFRFDSFSTTLYSLAAIVIGLILFGSIALIYNAFSISVSERTRQFGLLSSIGATKRQLRRMVRFEALAVSLVGIPVGILAGVGGIGVTLLCLADKFRAFDSGHVAMTLCVSPLSIAIAVAVALFTVLLSAWVPSRRAMRVSAVEAIRQNPDVRAGRRSLKTSKLTAALFGLPGVLAAKHYRRDRRKYRATVLSLFMSIVLFVSASAFTEYLSMTVSGGLGPLGYDLLYEATDTDLADRTPDELLARLLAADAVTGGAYVEERASLELLARPEVLTDRGAAFLKANGGERAEDEELSLTCCLAFADDASFRALLRENGLRERDYFDPTHPQALALDETTSFNNATHRYETLRFFERDDFALTATFHRDVPGYELYNIDRDENGARVYRYLKDGTEYADGEILDLPEREAIETRTLHVGRLLTKLPDFIRSRDSRWLIYPYSQVDAVLGEYADDAGNAFVFPLQSDDHAASLEAARTLLREEGMQDETLYDVAAAEESNRNIITIIRVFSYGFIVLISLIAAANVFNTISTNIHLRRREFAMLKSVGMTEKGFRRMMNFECLLYGSRALLYGLPVSCAVTFLIYCSVLSSYETTFRLPWNAILIAALSVFSVVFVTMLYAMRKVRRDNIIDVLKNENL